MRAGFEHGLGGLEPDQPAADDDDARGGGERGFEREHVVHIHERIHV
ncbi:hypothetical protein SDC9_176157 [bioreactor metagenome]|uniref:Uncharacterized protein n=1 Tax=bioreactor metagenome TaxID=1076179 RepID=A0A645GRZ6_9ZZZZ